MLIREMNAQECRDLLARLGTGRLGCARNNQPYVVPVYFAYEPDRLYGFSTAGQKIEWMRENPLVCVEADEVHSHNQWASVIVSAAMKSCRTSPNTSRSAVRLSLSSKNELCGGKQGTQLRNRGADRNLRLPFSTAFTLSS